LKAISHQLLHMEHRQKKKLSS